MTRYNLLIISVATLGLAACGGADTIPTTGDGSLVNDGDPGASTTGSGAGSGIFEEELGPGGNLLDDLVVYFEFDRSEIRSDFNAMLAAHGRYLASNPNAQIRLEGHADERGSREYNVGLGERRAQSVRQILLLQGATAGQLSTVSYGEERPAVVGSNEESYSLNRRVELVYR